MSEAEWEMLLSGRPGERLDAKGREEVATSLVGKGMLESREDGHYLTTYGAAVARRTQKAFAETQPWHGLMGLVDKLCEEDQ